MRWCTRSGGDLQGKQFVYIAGGEKTIELYTSGKHEFNVVERILQKANCAVALGGELLSENEIAQFQLVVVLVTSELFENKGIIELAKSAQNLSIPILPLMLENGLENRFNQELINLQCLYPFVKDSTQISFEEKLQDYFNTVIIGDELEKEVKESFDGYIFLSYRKKDRFYARQLMKLIHSFDFCRDIAIWFDEAIIPGENFNESIYQALVKSDIFILMVTPSILEGGNYVHEIEYPTAMKNNKLILPVEMVATDRNELKKYSGLTECISFEDTQRLRDALYELVRRMPKKQHEDMAYHTYLMGIAYLYGIDVEVDTERGLALLCEAIEKGCPHAAGKLAELYKDGKAVEVNYDKYLYWLGEKLKLFGDNISYFDFYDKLRTRLKLESDLRKEERYQDAAYHIKMLIDECSIMKNALTNNGFDSDFIAQVSEIQSRAYLHLSQIAQFVGYTFEQAQVFNKKSQDILGSISFEDSSLEQKLLTASFRVTGILNSVSADPHNAAARLDEAQSIIDSMKDALDNGKASDRRLVQWKRNQPLVWFLRSNVGSDIKQRRQYLDMAEKEFAGLIKEFPGDPTIKDDIAGVYLNQFLFTLPEDIEIAFSYAKKTIDMSLEYYYGIRHERSIKNLHKNINWVLRGLYNLSKEDNEKAAVPMKELIDELLNRIDNYELEESLGALLVQAASDAYKIKYYSYSLTLYNTAYDLYGSMLNKNRNKAELYVRRSCEILPWRYLLTFLSESEEEACYIIDEHLLLIETYRIKFGSDDAAQFVYDNCLFAIEAMEKIIDVLDDAVYMQKIIEMGLIGCRSAAQSSDRSYFEHFVGVINHYFQLINRGEKSVSPLIAAQVYQYNSHFNLISLTANGFQKANEYAEEAIRIFENLFINDPTRKVVENYLSCSHYMYLNLLAQNTSVEKLVHYIGHVFRPLLYLYRMEHEDNSFEKVLNDSKKEVSVLLESTYKDADALYEIASRGDPKACTALLFIHNTLSSNFDRCNLIMNYKQLLQHVNKLLNSLDNMVN